VSMDLDWLDPVHAPGVGTPVAGGATYREGHLAMEIVADSGRLTSLDVVEVNPVLDTAEPHRGARGGPRAQRVRPADHLDAGHPERAAGESRDLVAVIRSSSGPPDPRLARGPLGMTAADVRRAPGSVCRPSGSASPHSARPGYITVGHAEDLGSDRGRDAMEHRRTRCWTRVCARHSLLRRRTVVRPGGGIPGIVARARRAIPPGSVTVGSKWGYTYTADWRVDAPTHEVKSHTLPVFTRQLGESRAILGAQPRAVSDPLCDAGERRAR
jgi:hypothetical protein